MTLVDIEINLLSSSVWGRKILAECNEYLSHFKVYAYWRQSNRQKILTVRVPEPKYTESLKKEISFLRDYYQIPIDTMLTR